MKADTEEASLRAEYDALVRERLALFDKANAADAEHTRLEARRAELLPLIGNATAADELATLPAKMAAADQRATDLHAAADLLAPKIAALAPCLAAFSTARQDAKYRAAFEQHRRDTAALEAKLDELAPAITAWGASVDQFALAYRERFGGAPELERPDFRLAKALKLRALDLVPGAANFLDRRFPAECKSLVAGLARVAPATGQPAAAIDDAA